MSKTRNNNFLGRLVIALAATGLIGLVAYATFKGTITEKCKQVTVNAKKSTKNSEKIEGLSARVDVNSQGRLQHAERLRAVENAAERTQKDIEYIKEDITDIKSGIDDIKRKLAE